MFRLPEEFLPDLQSDDPDRVLAGVEELHFLTENLDYFEVPRWNLGHILRVLRNRITDDTISKLSRVIESYDGFLPPLTPVERIASLWQITLWAQRSYPALITSLYAKVNPEVLPDLLGLVRDTLPAAGGDAPQGHKHLLSYLLEGKPAFRAKVLEALADPVYAEVRAWLAPELEEWARVDAWWREHPEQAPE